MGAILGWGFAPWTGGPLSLIDGVGAAQFVAVCDGYAERFGDRWAVPPGLRAMVNTRGAFYDAETPVAQAA